MPSLTDPTNIQVSAAAPSLESRRPVTYLAVTLEAIQRARFAAWLHLHLTQITTEMQPTLARFQQEDDQVEGNMPGADYPYAGAFRVNYPLTKRKVREIANRIKQAYLDADPIWGIDLDDPAMFQTAIQLEKTLDTAMDYELDTEDDLAQACWEAAKHGLGVVAPTWMYHEERIRTLEAWQGWDGQRVESLQGMLDFETQYPTWREDTGLRAIHARLNRGQDVEREITVTKAVKNHPDFTHIATTDVRVYPSVNGYEGLRTTPLYGFVMKHTRFELEALRDQGVIDAEAVAAILSSPTTEEDADPQTQMQEYEIFKGTARYRLTGDDAPCRYHVWYAVAKQMILRVRFYAWWCAEADLIPFYVRTEEPGFFKRGIAWDVVDEHTTLNVLLNLYLNGVDMANSMKYRTKYRSLAHQMLLSRRYSPHLGLVWKDNPNEVDTMAQAVGHLPSIVTGLELIRRDADEGSGTSSLQSGRETPTDPTAPGNKTALLLAQVQPNEKDVLRSLAPAFDAVGRWTLWMYFQGLKLGWITELPGGVQISTELLPELAKHLRSRATLFDLDRGGRFERDVNLLTLTSKLIGQTRPDVVLKMLRIAISQAGGQWGRLVDSLALEQTAQVQPANRTPPTAATGNGHDPAAAMLHRMAG